jgi:antitoxin HicB
MEIFRNSSHNAYKSKIPHLVPVDTNNKNRKGILHDMRYRVYLQEDEDGIFTAEVPVLPGCISQGSTKEEAILNIKDAIHGYLSSLKKHNEPVPPTDEVVVEVDA